VIREHRTSSERVDYYDFAKPKRRQKGRTLATSCLSRCLNKKDTAFLRPALAAMWLSSTVTHYIFQSSHHLLRNTDEHKTRIRILSFQKGKYWHYWDCKLVLWAPSCPFNTENSGICSSETEATTYQTTRRHDPENHDISSSTIRKILCKNILNILK